jgi:hypothetical protein
MAGLFKPAITGTLTLEPEAEPSVVIAPAECLSGDNWRFLGVDLIDPSQSALARVVIDPLEGPRVKLVVGSGEHRSSWVLDGSECVAFAAKVQDSGCRSRNHGCP